MTERFMSRFLLGITLMGSVIPSAARASSAPPTPQSSLDVPGSIVISREVYYRSAVNPSVPAPAVRVTTSPRDVVIATASLGLPPLTEDEAASLSAPIRLAGQTARQNGALVSDQLALAQSGTNLTPGQLGGQSGSSGTIGQAMSALPAALGSLRSVLGLSR